MGRFEGEATERLCGQLAVVVDYVAGESWDQGGGRGKVCANVLFSTREECIEGP
jgi:hypothetical protein